MISARAGDGPISAASCPFILHGLSCMKIFDRNHNPRERIGGVDGVAVGQLKNAIRHLIDERGQAFQPG
jgi:hypothetical protein